MEKEGEKKDEQVRYGFDANYQVTLGKVSQHFVSQSCVLHTQTFLKFPTQCSALKEHTPNTDWSRDCMGQR